MIASSAPPAIGDLEGRRALVSGGTVDVDATAEIVFPYLSDPFRQSEWTPDFRELVQPPDGPPGLGARYRGRLRVFGTVNFVIDQFVPGRMFRVDTDPPGARLTHCFTINPTAAGARVSHLVEPEPRTT